MIYMENYISCYGRINLAKSASYVFQNALIKAEFWRAVAIVARLSEQPLSFQEGLCIIVSNRRTGALLCVQ